MKRNYSTKYANAKPLFSTSKCLLKYGQEMEVEFSEEKIMFRCLISPFDSASQEVAKKWIKLLS
jgi:hypothetical protein